MVVSPSPCECLRKPREDHVFLFVLRRFPKKKKDILFFDYLEIILRDYLFIHQYKGCCIRHKEEENETLFLYCF